VAEWWQTGGSGSGRVADRWQISRVVTGVAVWQSGIQGWQPGVGVAELQSDTRWQSGRQL
jgi:hypothetical protein